jgi:hypothetical protein
MFKALPLCGMISFSFALEMIVLIFPRVPVPLHGKHAERGWRYTKIH